jgi:hypothetical protein
MRCCVGAEWRSASLLSVYDGLSLRLFCGPAGAGEELETVVRRITKTVDDLFFPIMDRQRQAG